MKYIYTILALLLIANLKSQTTFSKYFEIYSSISTVPWNFIVEDNEIYIPVSHRYCASSCPTSIVHLKTNGEVLDTAFFNIAITGVENPLLKVNGNFMMLGNYFDVLKIDQNLKEVASIKLKNPFKYRRINGWLQYLDSYYVSLLAIVGGKERGAIIKYDTTDYSIVDTFIIDQAFDESTAYESNVYDLQVSSDSSLFFIYNTSTSEIADTGFALPDFYIVSEIDTSGVLLNQNIYSARRLLVPFPSLKVMQNGDYVFGTGDPFYFSFSDWISYVSNETGKKKWHIPLPFDFNEFGGSAPGEGRRYYIYDISEAKNGDILLCGKLLDTSKLYDFGDPGDYWGGFVTRISPTGEVLWQKIYIEPNKNKDEFPDDAAADSGLIQLEELDDESIVIVGTRRRMYKSKPTISDLWVLRLDRDGCLDGYPCNQEEVLLKNEDIMNEKGLKNINIYPNPTSNFINFESKTRYISFEIISTMGQIIKFGKLHDKTQINIGDLNRGVYFVKLKGKDSIVYFSKFLKI